MTKVSFDNISDTINQLINLEVNFFCYKLPGKEEIKFSLFNDKEISHFDNESKEVSIDGILFYPFSETDDLKPLIIKRNLSFSHDEIPNINKSVLKPFISKRSIYSKEGRDIIEQNKEEYTNLLSKTIKKLETENLEKIVISRQIVNKKISIKKSGNYFSELANKYNSAFVYFLNIPGITSWMGATPELFLSGKNNIFETVSLAGTANTSSEKTIWGKKEIEEQNIVSKYIEQELTKLSATGISKEGPNTIAAGNLSHIQTKFKFNIENNKILNFIKNLHPTPAVCGTPKDDAKKFIKSLEVNSREYYSGIIGILDTYNTTNLFVNLRCLQFNKSGGILYVGGGITKDSDPEKEWEETCIKAQTLLSVLEKI